MNRAAQQVSSPYRCRPWDRNGSERRDEASRDCLWGTETLRASSEIQDHLPTLEVCVAA